MMVSSRFLTVLLSLCCLEALLWMKELGAQGYLLIPGLPKKKFIQLRDINIGFVMSLSLPSNNSDAMCSEKFSQGLFMTFPEVISYAVERVNKEIPLPKNLKLGFVILDDCYLESAALFQTLSFLPQVRCQEILQRAGALKTKVQESYDVVAVVGSLNSHQSIVMSHVLGAAHLPHVSIFSTSDELSDPFSTSAYFIRLIPSDRFQFRAIFEIIKKFNWTFVNVVYETGSYGENAIKQLTDLVFAHHYCLNVVRKLSIGSNLGEIKEVAEDLVTNRGNSRVVVLIITADQAHHLLSYTRTKVSEDTFVWIATDSWSNEAAGMVDFGDFLLDSLLVNVKDYPVYDFDRYFLGLNPSKTTNPWFPDYWEDLFQCSLRTETCPQFQTIPDSERLDDPLLPLRGYVMDAVYMIANATSRILKSDNCKGLKLSAARLCVNGPQLFHELRNTKATGFSGWIEIDKAGNRLGLYEIKQLRPGSAKRFTTVSVAEFDSVKNSMKYIGEWSWAYHTIRQGFNYPESVCSFPCGQHSAKIQQSSPCCWTCQDCHVDERLTRNGTVCESCPKFSWPDPTTGRSTCYVLPIDTMAFDGYKGIWSVFLSLAFLLVCCVVFLFFFFNRESPIIKASSVHLSFIMLGAICTGYITVLTILVQPTNYTCKLTFMLFSVSFTLVYGPLLLRTLWIYRIFQAGKSSTKRPPMTNISHQILLCTGFLLIQAVLSLVPMVVYSDWSELTEVSRLEPRVEHACSIPSVSMATFMVYNLCLIFTCGALAFKARHLPDNFNESRYISLCVWTNVIIFLSFTPTYMVSNSQIVRSMILLLVLFINHSAALLFLFFPKIYGVMANRRKVVSWAASVRAVSKVSPEGSHHNPNQYPRRRHSPKAAMFSTHPHGNTLSIQMHVQPSPTSTLH